MIRLFIDMDGTLAEFKNVDSIEQLYEKGYFLNLRPQNNVLDGIKTLLHQSSIPVYILSSYLFDSKYALVEKNQWIDKYIPEIDEEHRIFVKYGTSKKDSIGDIGSLDILLDDYTQNLNDWISDGGRQAIKLVNNINDTHMSWRGERISYNSANIERELQLAIETSLLNEREKDSEQEKEAKLQEEKKLSDMNKEIIHKSQLNIQLLQEETNKLQEENENEKKQGTLSRTR